MIVREFQFMLPKKITDGFFLQLVADDRPAAADIIKIATACDIQIICRLPHTMIQVGHDMGRFNAGVIAADKYHGYAVLLQQIYVFRAVVFLDTRVNDRPFHTESNKPFDHLFFIVDIAFSGHKDHLITHIPQRPLDMPDQI